MFVNGGEGVGSRWGCFLILESEPRMFFLSSLIMISFSPITFLPFLPLFVKQMGL